MVWFQCEDCGENLKKPKLPHHFCICPATKLSCIDCGEMFGQQSAQGHKQCITEAEKYGPKGQAKSPYGAQSKPNKPKPNTDVDVNVGLPSRPPWRCSLCNTTTTSQQTLQSHADGKKHRAKARAYHASQKQSSPAQGSAADASNEDQVRDEEAKDGNTTEILKAEDAHKEAQVVVAEQTVDGTPKSSKKRKSESSNVEGTKKDDFSNGEVIQADKEVLKCSKKKKQSSETNPSDDACPDQDEQNQGLGKIKWKQLVTSILRSNPDGCLKLKKLKKLFLKAVAESGATNKAMEDDDLLEKLMKKVSKTSRFVVEGKVVRFASDTGAASA